MPFSIVALAATVAAGCAAHRPAGNGVPAAPKAAPAEAPAPPTRTPSSRPCGSADREFEAWFRGTFGGGYELFNDGPDPARIRSLTGEQKAEAQRMLRRGLAACSTLAVLAIERAGWRDFVPDLARAVGADAPDFRAHVILALEALGDTQDFTGDLATVLSSSSTEARITAAMGARRFSLDRLRRPLLDRVRQDPCWLVRVHAAESLYELADIYPRRLQDHPAIAAAVQGHGAGTVAPLELLGACPPLSVSEAAQLAVAADQLDAEIVQRLSAGRCSNPATPALVDLYAIRLDERPIVALTVEESVGSCERKLAFVVFLESPGGFRQVLGGGVSGRDPLKTEIATHPKRATVTYTRATGLLTVGAVTLDTAKTNVAVLSAGPNGVATRYQGKLGLTFQRHGRQPSATGLPILDFQEEIALAVRALLDRTPELRALLPTAPAR